MDIQAICSACKKFSYGFDGLKYLYEELSQYGVRIRYEKININGDSEFSDDERLGEFDPEWRLGRVVLSGDRNKTNKFNRNNIQGTYIIDGFTWTVIGVAPRSCAPKPQVATINALLEDKTVTISKIIDGTVVFLYCHDGNWNIATATSYDLTFKRWIGPNTYAEEFFNTASEDFKSEVGMELDSDGRLTFSNLDASSTWCFIMRTKNFHPFIFDPSRLVFISKITIDESGITEHLDNPFRGVSSQEFLDEIPSSLESLESGLGEDSILRAINNNDINYGYIVHPNDKSQPNYIVESQLLRKIRYYAYYMPKKLKVLLNENNREIFRVWNNVIHNKDCAEFLSMFPQYAPHHKACRDVLDTIGRIIVDTIKNPRKSIHEDDRALLHVTKTIVKSIHRRENLSTIKFNQQSVIKDFVYNLYHMEHYINIPIKV